MLILMRLVQNNRIVQMGMFQTALMKTVVVNFGLEMDYVMVKTKSGAVILHVMMMMEVTVVQSIHVGIVHV